MQICVFLASIPLETRQQICHLALHVTFGMQSCHPCSPICQCRRQGKADQPRHTIPGEKMKMKLSTFSLQTAENSVLLWIPISRISTDSIAKASERHNAATFRLPRLKDWQSFRCAEFEAFRNSKFLWRRPRCCIETRGLSMFCLDICISAWR
jgi:hypothetical protein